MPFFDPEVISHWISTHSQWALFIVFSIAFIESLAVVGLLMPGWLLLVGVGVLIGTQSLNFYLASLFCFFGAVLGEYLSYLVGIHYQQRVHNWAVFKRHPTWLTNTELFFQRYGRASIALGRFVGPIRAFVPLLAGMTGMSAMKFQVTNVLSAMVWAPVYLIPGVILGASLDSSVDIPNLVRWILLSNIAFSVLSAWFLISHSWDYLMSCLGSGKSEGRDRSLVFKILMLLSLFLLSMVFLINGPYHQYFFRLLESFFKIISPGFNAFFG